MTELEQKKKEMVNLARSLFERGYSVGAQEICLYV